MAVTAQQLSEAVAAGLAPGIEKITSVIAKNATAISIAPFTGSDGSHPTVNQWFRELGRAKLKMPVANDEAMLTLAKQSVTHTAADFMVAKLTETPQITWQQLKAAFRTRFHSEAEASIAKQKLKKLKQGKQESVRNFVEKIRELLAEAYSDQEIAEEAMQRRLVELFIDGLADHHIRKKVISSRPADLEAALRTAAQEADLDIESRIRGNQTKIQDSDVEFMEIDAVTHQMSQLKGQLDHLSSDVNQVLQIQKQHRMPRGRSSNSYSNGSYNGSNYSNSRRRTYSPAVSFNRQNSAFQSSRRFSTNRSPSPRPRPLPLMSVSTTPTPNMLPNSYRWTRDGRPICQNCGTPGHRWKQCFRRKAAN